MVKRERLNWPFILALFYSSLVLANLIAPSLSYRDFSPQVIVCAGHSLWFKHFFNTYLPRDEPGATQVHDAKDCKMKNGACVAFDLEVSCVILFPLLFSCAEGIHVCVFDWLSICSVLGIYVNTRNLL